jgi:hypothetical protein
VEGCRSGYPSAAAGEGGVREAVDRMAKMLLRRRANSRFLG